MSLDLNKQFKIPNSILVGTLCVLAPVAVLGWLGFIGPYAEQREISRQAAPASTITQQLFGLGENAFTIRVTGTAGLKFSGGYMTVHAGSSESKSVDGVVPAEFAVKGRAVSGTFQKQSEGGTLEVAVLRDGVVAKSENTTAAYGLVSIATD